MNILALCTSSTSGSIAIYKDDHFSYLSYLDIKITHSERLMPQIDFGLKQSKLQIKDIDSVVIANGPGSFTGIRIGLATAKGICMANEIPLIPVNTLDLLAANLIDTKRDILVMIDAKMQEIYGALYTSEKKVLIPPQNTKPKSFLQKIEQPVIIVGDVHYKFSEMIKDSGIEAIYAPDHLNIPLASGLIFFVKKFRKTAYDFKFISELEPYYLRKSQAEINKNKRK